MASSVGGLRCEYVGADNWRLRRQEWVSRALLRPVQKKRSSRHDTTGSGRPHGQNGSRVSSRVSGSLRSNGSRGAKDSSLCIVSASSPLVERLEPSVSGAFALIF